LGRIAVELERALTRRRRDGTPGRMTPRILAYGDGWTVADVVCTSGPHDRPYEERHERYAIAIALTGSFQYRSPLGRGLMTPGSLMLGNQGHCFECGHEHGEGDRCVAFWYEVEYFERLAADAGARDVNRKLRVPCLPPLRPLSPLVARVGAGAMGVPGLPWEELAITLAGSAVRLAVGVPPDQSGLPLNAESRVTRTVRAIDRHPDAALNLGLMAREAGLSPYYFLRTFERVTRLTPHQYVLRARLREAATRLVAESAKVIDVALDCGFSDISNFNRAFRTEFGVSPRIFRQTSPEPVADDNRDLARSARLHADSCDVDWLKDGAHDIEP
jgi:AraC family transcriptional regulator